MLSWRTRVSGTNILHVQQTAQSASYCTAHADVAPLAGRPIGLTDSCDILNRLCWARRARKVDTRPGACPAHPAGTRGPGERVGDQHQEALSLSLVSPVSLIVSGFRDAIDVSELQLSTSLPQTVSRHFLVRHSRIAACPCDYSK